MFNSVTPFDYEGSTIRTITKGDGETWFVLANILTVLGIKRKPAAIIERLDDDVRQTYPIRDSLGREQQAHVVNEVGLYDVVIRSDAPAAKSFRRWVTHEAGRRLGSAYQTLHGGLVQGGGQFRLRVRGRWRHGGRRVLLGVGVLFR